jgi:plastocyanin
MRRTRRDVLKAGGLTLTTGLLAGCNTQSRSGDESTDTATDTPTDTAATTTGSGGAEASVDAAVAVAAEWNAYRARLFDAVTAGAAGRPAAGAGVVQSTFARFEGASGEWGAHEQLEATNESNYEAFETHLSELGSALEAGEMAEAREMAAQADQNLLAAQRGRVDGPVLDALAAARFAVRARDVGMLAAAGATDAAAAVGESVLADFEGAAVHDAMEEASGELYEAFEGGLKSAVSAADEGDAEAAREQSTQAFGAGLSVGYELAPEPAAGAAELSALQSVGFDAATLSTLGGPGTDYAHAASLTRYRARVHDADWLAAAGADDRASKTVQDVFADFEGARAHEALEEADYDAYESFEAGLSDLRSAIEGGDAEARATALEQVDTALLAGVEALAGADGRAVLESAFFRARLADANERYRRGDGAAASATTQSLFQRFESDEAGFHEFLEETSEELYHRFEEEHLVPLVSAYEAGDDDAVAEYHGGVQSALVEFETTVGTSYSAPAESVVMAARTADAAGLAAVGDADRAAAVVEDAFGAFEADTGGFHEALEEADHDLYESFETELGGVRSAAGEGGDAFAAATAFETKAVDAMYAVAAGGSGARSDAAGGVGQSAFQYFEGARVHELVEEADRSAYEGFEERLGSLVSALESGEGVADAANAYADASTTAQFAVVGAVGKAPAGSADSGGEETESGGTEYAGGPDVVPAGEAEADHVVEAKAVAFDPAELTVSVGDTVAFEWAAGEAHNVVARESELPDGATYWASGGFDSEEAAVEGWENGEGAVTEGTAYVHTFETAGEHPYYCVPHEAAGMEGTIVVEE